MIQLLCECVPLNRIASVAARCSKSDMWCYCLDQRYANENSNKDECRTNRTVQYFHSTRNTIDCSHVWNDRNPLHGTFYPSSMHHKNCFAVFQSNRFGDYQKVTIFPFICFLLSSDVCPAFCRHQNWSCTSSDLMATTFGFSAWTFSSLAHSNCKQSAANFIAMPIKKATFFASLAVTVVP